MRKSNGKNNIFILKGTILLILSWLYSFSITSCEDDDKDSTNEEEKAIVIIDTIHIHENNGTNDSFNSFCGVYKSTYNIYGFNVDEYLCIRNNGKIEWYGYKEGNGYYKNCHYLILDESCIALSSTDNSFLYIESIESDTTHDQGVFLESHSTIKLRGKTLTSIMSEAEYDAIKKNHIDKFSPKFHGEEYEEIEANHWNGYDYTATYTYKGTILDLGLSTIWVDIQDKGWYVYENGEKRDPTMDEINELLNNCEFYAKSPDFITNYFNDFNEVVVLGANKKIYIAYNIPIFNI